MYKLGFEYLVGQQAVHGSVADNTTALYSINRSF